MPINRDKNLIFIHIPKTAGMSIEKALDLNELNDPNLTPSPQHLTGKELKQKLGTFWDKAFRFTVIRDPETRIVSEFLWRIKRNLNNLQNNEEDFNKFLDFVDKVVASGDYSKKTYDHFRPQVDFIDDVKVFYYDQLNELESYFNITLPKINQRNQEPNNLLSERNVKKIRQIYYKDFILYENRDKNI